MPPPMPTMKRQRPELRGTIAPAFFSFLACALVLFIILAGVINHSLSQIHFLKVSPSVLFRVTCPYIPRSTSPNLMCPPSWTAQPFSRT